MLNSVYNKIIRKLTVAFGSVFNNLTLVRYNPDLSEQERFLIPIAYATKELYVMRLQEDPDLDKKVQITLPRLSYVLNGISYDVYRKQNTNWKNFASSTDGSVTQYNFVPYDFDFSLFLYVRNIEDGIQVMEKIIPYFTPDYTIKLNLIPDLGITKEIPIVLKDTNYEVVYEGDIHSDTRMVIWTLSFTVKGYLFGGISPLSSGLIRTSITNIIQQADKSLVEFKLDSSGAGNFSPDETVYQGYSLGTATATAKVTTYNSTLDTLTVDNIRGNFVIGKSIKGVYSNAEYTLSSYSNIPFNVSQIIITPTPTDANTNVTYGYTTTINETPDIDTNVLTTYDFFGDLSNNTFGADDWLSQAENLVDLGSEF